MYSPQEINRIYMLKRSMIFFFPILFLVAALFWFPPKMLTVAIGLGEKMQLQEIADSLHTYREQLQRKETILQSLDAQLQDCRKRADAIPIVATDGVQLPAIELQFAPWAAWAKTHPGKTFSEYRTAEAQFYKSQLEAIYASLSKTKSNE